MASKDALLDGIVEAMTWEAEMPPADGVDWRDALRHLAREIRGVILRHPAAAGFMMALLQAVFEPRTQAGSTAPGEPSPALRYAKTSTPARWSFARLAASRFSGWTTTQSN